MLNGNAKNEPMRENESVGADGACSQIQECVPAWMLITEAGDVFLTAV